MSRLKRKKNWIPEDLDEGAFTAEAKKAGMGVQEYADYVLKNKEKFDTKTIRQANLAKVFARLARKKKKKNA